MSALLSQVATIVSVSSTALGMTRQDKSASALAEREHHAKGGIAKVNVSRLAGAEDRIKGIRQQVSAAREVVIDTTTAWGDRRLLANVNIEKMLQRWMPIKDEFDRQVNSLRNDAAALIAQAQQNLGTFQVEVPTEDEIREAFSLEFKMEAIPDASKFTSNLDAQVEAELRRRFEADIAAAYQQAQQDALRRLAKPLENLVERMGAYQKREDSKANGIETSEGYFRDSVIDNVNKVAEVFASFNLTGDPALDALARELDVFRGLDGEALRKHKDVRDATAQKASEILKSLGDWIN
jgi:hypothetical protein